MKISYNKKSQVDIIFCEFFTDSNLIWTNLRYFDHSDLLVGDFLQRPVDTILATLLRFQLKGEVREPVRGASLPKKLSPFQEDAYPLPPRIGPIPNATPSTIQSPKSDPSKSSPICSFSIKMGLYSVIG